MTTTMSSTDTWCLIENLHPSITTSVIKLRLVRVYERPSAANKKDVVSLECLFHDSEGERIEATVPRGLISMFKSTLKEGTLFGLKKFLVIFNTNKFKIIEHKFKIKFLGQTIITKMFEENFPMQMFAFKSFEDIQSMENMHENVLFDVIGLLLTRGQVEIINCSNGTVKKLLEFMLQDTEGKRLSCTLWGDYADQFLHLLEQHGQPSNIIIMQFGHATMYKGQIRVCSSYYVTKILVNADVPEVADFRQRIVIDSEVCTPIISTTSQVTTSMNDDCVLTPIEQLFFGEQIGRFWIVGKVIDIDLDDGWFYIACKKCRSRLYKQEHQFYCKKCKKSDVSGNIRYKLTLHVVDETGSAAIILWERECQQLIGKTATELMENDKKSHSELMQNDKNEPDVPSEIYNAIMNKKFLFMVELKAEHNSEHRGAYSVCKVTDDLTYINTYNTSHLDSQESNCHSKLESSYAGVEKIEDDVHVETPSSKLDGIIELVDDGKVKRSLADAFSSTISAKKSKAIIKEEKD